MRHHNFARFLVGQTISQTGDSVYLVAFAWHALVISDGGAAALGATMSALFVGQLVFLVLGGVIVDRFSRRTIVVVSDVLQLAISGTMAVFAWSGALTIWPLALLAFLFGAAQAFALPALPAFLPDTVPREHLPAATSLFHGMRTMAAVVGPALGGAVVALWGVGAAFAFNAATFAVSAALLATARTLPGAKPAEEHGSIVASARAGVRYVRRVPWLWRGILIFALYNFAEVGARSVTMRQIIVGPLGAGPEALGLVTSAMMLGSGVAFAVAGKWPPALRWRGAFAYGATTAAALLFVGMAFSPSVPVLVALMVLYGAGFSTFNVLWESTVQQQIDARYRGRVFSLDMLGSFALLPVSTLLAAGLSSALGERPAMALSGAAMLALSAVGLAMRRSRRLDVPASDEPTTT